MIEFINKYPIKKKFQIILLIASMSTLLLASTGLFISMFFTQRIATINKYHVIGELLSDNTSAALMFLDPKSAKEILAALRFDKYVGSAYIYDIQNRVFAKYEQNKNNNNETTYESKHNITIDNEIIGTLVINVKRSSLYSGMYSYSIIALFVLCISIIFTFFMSSRIHAKISNPIIKLGKIAKEVSSTKNYSLRAPVETHDELGSLAILFNDMLKQTEIQNIRLEETVALRTKELRESEATYKGIVENSMDLIMLTKNDGTIVYLSPACSKIMEYNPEELTNTKIRPIHPDDLEKVDTIFKKAAEDGLPGSNFEYRIITKHGVTKWISHSWSPIFESNNTGNVKMIVSIVRDINEEKNIAHQKEEMQKQVFLSSKLASIGELAAGIAHEINNPLAIIQGTIDIIDDEIKDKKLQNDLVINTIGKQKKSVQRIATIVNGLRVYARMDITLEENIDLHKVIDDSVALVEFIYSRESIVIEKNFKADFFIVKGNTGKVQQVIMNMLGNAKDALKNQSNKVIRFTTENQRDKIVLRISDNGSGIPEKIMDKIFDTFFTTKPVGQGTGLGLGIVHSIVEGMRGIIKVESKEGLGTTFIITLPTLISPKIQNP